MHSHAAAAPSLILHHARVLTMGAEQQTAEAVAIHGDVIRDVGSNADIHRLAGPSTEVIDCTQRLLVPGFIDAHVHLLGAAARIGAIDCSTATSIGDIIAAVRRSAPDRAGWLRAFGYHEVHLAERRHPSLAELDLAAPAHAVRIVHATGHASVLNSLALRAAGIDVATPEPPGGTISRDLQSGAPDGLLIEMEDWLDSRLPVANESEIAHSMSMLSARLLRAGVTSVQDLGHRNDRRRAEFLSSLVTAHAFAPRITMATGFEAFAAGDDGVACGVGRGPIKIMLNETGGELLPSPASLAYHVLSAHAAGRQVAIHAVGRAAIEASLAAISRAQATDGRGGRHRIEHASITTQESVRRMQELGVVAVSNPGFIWQHGDRYLQTVLPPDLPHLYDVAGLMHAGVKVAAGSDAPIGPFEPTVGIGAVCRRMTANGRTIAGETLPLQQSLAPFTREAAAAAFEEDRKGIIAPGYLADLVLLDPAGESLHVDMTVLGGAVVAS